MHSLFLKLTFVVPAVVVSALPASTSTAKELKETFVSKGIIRKVGGYRPIRAKMDQEADIVQKAPEDLESPKYGKLEFGEKSWAFVLDEPEEGDARLYVDSNGDGDLTNDPGTKWVSNTRGKYTMYSGEGEIDLGNGKIGAVNFYRFDPKDERRKMLKDTLMYYRDFGFEYSFKLDEKEFSTFVSGHPAKGARFPIDRDGNGITRSRREVAILGKPFNFTGTTYVFDLADGALTLKESDDKQELTPLPPNLEIGQGALEFTAKTMADDEVNFPKSYAGKIVMLDFWAIWCGPCIGEIPNMKVAYEKWHDNGFDILGVSFDPPNSEDKVAEFLKKREMPWSQIYEGKLWETTIGLQHDVSSIPFVLLVDGDSGKILATAQQLRGPGLSDFIKEKLKAKFGDDFVDDEDSEEDEENEEEEGAEA